MPTLRPQLEPGALAGRSGKVSVRGRSVVRAGVTPENTFYVPEHRAAAPFPALSKRRSARPGRPRTAAGAGPSRRAAGGGAARGVAGLCSGPPEAARRGEARPGPAAVPPGGGRGRRRRAARGAAGGGRGTGRGGPAAPACALLLPPPRASPAPPHAFPSPHPPSPPPRGRS